MHAPGSFIYSLRNKDDLAPFKSKLKNEQTLYAIFRNAIYGPTIGGGHDLYIANNAGLNTHSRTNFSITYSLPPGYPSSQTKAYSLLAGSPSFTPSEVEVLYLN